jgi:hypothetical protein
MTKTVRRHPENFDAAPGKYYQGYEKYVWKKPPEKQVLMTGEDRECQNRVQIRTNLRPFAFPCSRAPISSVPAVRELPSSAGFWGLGRMILAILSVSPQLSKRARTRRIMYSFIAAGLWDTMSAWTAVFRFAQVALTSSSTLLISLRSGWKRYHIHLASS